MAVRDVPGARAWRRAHDRASRDVAAAVAARNEAICRAVKLDFTGDEIANAFGLSRPRIYQIIAEANRG